MDAVIKLVNQYPGRRWIIFFKSIKEAEICGKLLPNSAVYHSKMSKKAKAEVLERMETGKVSRLIGVDALNEGLDIPSLDAGISVSGDSSLLVFTQALGRTVRLGKDKKALFFNLYTEGTREEKWVKTKTLKIKPIWLKSIPTSPDTLGG
jgi:superfamily II DNA or RNA helicase